MPWHVRVEGAAVLARKQSPIIPAGHKAHKRYQTHPAMNEQTEREAMRREVARKKVVYRLPGTETLPPPRSLTYRATSGAGIPMDV